MLTLSLLGLAAFASASPLLTRNTTLAPGHYLAENITSQTFFNNSCTADTVTIRKEWRSLTDAEKNAFISAEQCLISLPATTSLPGATTRFDDFQAAHQQGTNTTYGDIIHYTGQFLAWHRWMIHLHELALINECNYTGTIPWWDEALDAASGDFFQSDMWEDQYFGGNGSYVDSDGNNCVTTGSFANRTEHIGPLEETTDYCFARNFNQTKGLTWGARSQTDACYEYSDFTDFYGCMAYAPHIAGHQATGGIMTDVDSSPGDPVFYLHHNYLDRLYWQWQQINPTERLYLVGGNTTVTEPSSGWETMTLEYEMNMFGIADNVTIATVSNIQGGYLCYEFEY
ncbi:hypothetical protein BP6252_01669 [Coleophoma cylindrospora]|uniref:Tyrosinase copper-binding domain-containing protein n=1 Tax=Coleophoma cylindrospora TaxID=1849047 RepID=A0A3D8STL0_9HELO|nr:hypothetical protein BP6252_01669 [Coleophoma cylindrospora]